jgi:hypothetical protein
MLQRMTRSTTLATTTQQRDASQSASQWALRNPEERQMTDAEVAAERFRLCCAINTARETLALLAHESEQADRIATMAIEYIDMTLRSLAPITLSGEIAPMKIENFMGGGNEGKG